MKVFHNAPPAEIFTVTRRECGSCGIKNLLECHSERRCSYISSSMRYTATAATGTSARSAVESMGSGWGTDISLNHAQIDAYGNWRPTAISGLRPIHADPALLPTAQHAATVVAVWSTASLSTVGKSVRLRSRTRQSSFIHGNRQCHDPRTRIEPRLIKRAKPIAVYFPYMESSNPILYTCQIQ